MHDWNTTDPTQPTSSSSTREEETAQASVSASAPRLINGERVKVCQSRTNPDAGCHRAKPLSAFPPHPKSADGRFNLCSECLAKTANRAAKVRQRLLQEKRERREEVRKGALELQRDLERQREVRLHLGYGVIEQRRAEMAPFVPTVPTVPTVPSLPSPEGPAGEDDLPLERLTETSSSRWAALDAVSVVSFDEWLTKPATEVAAHGEAFLVALSTHAPTGEGALLIWREGDVCYLLSGDATRWPTPQTPIPESVLSYIIRAKTGTEGDGPILGVRFA